MLFTPEDGEQLLENGIGKEKVVKQIETFKEGIAFMRLDKAAIVGDGIAQFSEKEANLRVKRFETERHQLSLLKFVPASGAASRMFKALFDFLEDYHPSKETFEAYIDRTRNKEIKIFMDGLHLLPFYERIQSNIKGKAASKGEEKHLFVKEMLNEDRLNFGFYPKGLLPFHKYGTFISTAFEAHLREAALYAETNATAHLHFTISPQHEKMFEKEYASASKRVSKETGVDFQVSFSFQKPATDTIAVDLENNVFRNLDGSLLFRPGGHGALIENLSEQDADIIFIKNIDNVVPQRLLKRIADSKKLLAGLLLEVQGKVFEYAEKLDEGHISAEELAEIEAFLADHLNVRFANSFSSFSLSEQILILQDKLNRPIRICGMVKNEGEPGGGPFWVKDSHENISLQIVESAQVDMNNASQVSIFKSATHFNPVDIVCGVKNYKGEKYDLLQYVDAKQGFITEKTKEGKKLKALELPGLWNGAMAFWNTIFVEVPVETFNPVKTINDLLRPSHQIV
ncbi:MAG: DUF4301 family protein [Flavobacteriales bacterium]|nr:MAG: DUF4301 family protein [Flavobacteriales bacterium]